jgi:Lrp/AsnC family leucine-responsive transcriptional regulator
MRGWRDLDGIDRSILRALVADGRASVQEVADAVGLRRPAVHERVKRLEADGFIRGYAAQVDPAQSGQELLAFVYLQVNHGDGHDCLAGCSSVAEALRALPAVLEVHTLAGDEDLLVKVRVGSLRQLEDLVLRRISGIPAVRKVRSSVALSTQLERPTQIPPEPAPTDRRRPKGRGGAKPTKR